MIIFYKNSFLFKRIQLLILFFVCFLASSFLYAENTYIKCWQNTEGLTECGNRIPREYYNQRIRYIDDQGITRKIKEREKNREERDSQRKMEHLLAEEADKKRQTDEYDDILLKTYLTIDDLLSSLNARLEIITARSIVLDSIIERRKESFNKLIKQAANMERSGRKKPAWLIAKLTAARKDITAMKAQVIEQQENTKMIKSVFAHDVERFVISKSNRIKHSLTATGQSNKLHAALINCSGQSECDFYWGTSNQFVEESATTKVLYSTDKVIVTDIPYKIEDIAMSLSISDNTFDSDFDNEAHTNKVITLTIRCNPQREGRELCNSKQVSKHLTEFRDIIITQ